jgi:hypothetical protein
MQSNRQSALTLLALLALAPAAVLTPGLAMAQDTAQDTVAAKPETVVPQAVVDVGREQRGEKIKHTFEIHNEGSAPLKLERVKPTCGCTVANYDEVIAPGAVGSLVAQVDTAEFRGPIAKSISVFTNDPDNPRLSLVVKADVRSQVDVSPGYARFVVVQGGEYNTSKQILWSPGKPDLVVSKANSPYKFVTTSVRQLEEGDSDYRKDSNRWEVSIKLDEDAPLGPMADYVKVETNHPKQKTVRIPVSGIVRPILAVTPQVADFGRRESGEEHTATLEIRNLSSNAVELLTVTTDVAGLEAEIESVEAGRLFNVVLTLAPGVDKGRFRGKVTVETNSASQPIVEIDVTGQAL